MDDGQIVELYWRWDEAAIRETEEKYGGLCRGIAQNILKSAQERGETPARLAQRMLRLRKRLKKALEKEGYL